VSSAKGAASRRSSGIGVDRSTVRAHRDAGFGSLGRLQLLAQIGDEGDVDLLTVEVGSRLTRFTCLLFMQLLLGRNGCIQLPQAAASMRARSRETSSCARWRFIVFSPLFARTLRTR
jgi:hypothetical protein